MYNILDYFEIQLKQFLEEMIGECTIEYQYGTGIKFLKEVGKDTFVLIIHVSNDDYKYVSLTNILILPSMRTKGVSVEIINKLLSLCKEVAYDCYVTGIASERWKQGLLKHGGVEDNQEDVQIIRSKWVNLNTSKQLRFVEFEGELILDSELEQFKDKKSRCIAEVSRIFKSWGTDIDIVQSNGYVISITNNDSYYVIINYRIVNMLDNLIKEAKLEKYLKEKKQIGLFG